MRVTALALTLTLHHSHVGLPENVAEDNARAVALMAEGDCDYVTNDVAAILGRPPRSFEQFATDYV